MTTHELIDRFCESRRRWLIVTGVTFLAAVVVVLPQVDQYLSLHADEDDKAARLVEARQTATLLPGMRTRVEETEAKLASLVARTLTAENVAEFRSDLVQLVRQSGCQVRRIGVGGVRSRQWRENDKPLLDAKAKAGRNTSFALETRPVSLSITGNISELRDFLGRIESSGMMMHAKQFDLRPAGRAASQLQMELELWCFALTRGKA